MRDVVLVGYAPLVLGATLATGYIMSLSITKALAFAVLLTVIFWATYIKLRLQGEEGQVAAS